MIAYLNILGQFGLKPECSD